MSLPENFTEWEHLQDTIRLYHNKLVAQYFKNQEDDSIATPKAALKHACKIKDEDTAAMTFIRLWLFEITAGHAQSLQPTLVGMPLLDWARETQYKPQIKLYFREIFDHEKHFVQGLEQVRGEIGFRIMDRTPETISRSDAVNYARDIKRVFVSTPVVWKKGKFKCTYIDLENGYDLRILCSSKLEGESTIKSVLQIMGKAFNDNYFQFIENNKEFPANPGTHTVYGKTVKKIRKRPNADCKLTHAQLIIPGQIKPINLVSVGRRLKAAIEYADYI